MHALIDDLFDSMPWDEIDNVVFDVGNVLLLYSPDQLLQKTFPDDPDIRAVLKEQLYQSPYWVMLDRGSVSREEVTAVIARHTGLSKDLIDRASRAIYGMDQAIEEGVKALEAVKAHGKKCYVLSNYSADGFAKVRERFDFFNLFDGIVVSAHLKLVKPERAIFDHVIQTYQLDPARTLFIDDSNVNIEAALMAGWHGFCLNRPGKLKEWMKL